MTPPEEMTAEDIKHFLVTYFISEQRVVVQEFGTDNKAAMKAYLELEAEYRNSDDTDIVLLGADSLATVKRTHSSYFPDENAGKSAFAHLFLDDNILLGRDGPVVLKRPVAPRGRRR